MDDVNLYIETDAKRAKKESAIAMWLMTTEYKGSRRDMHDMICLSDVSENEALLTALDAALGHLVRPCALQIHTSNIHIVNTLNNYWHIQWQKNDWHKSDGKPVAHADIWQDITDKLQDHIYTVSGKRHEYLLWMQSEIRREATLYEGR